MGYNRSPRFAFLLYVLLCVKLKSNINFTVSYENSTKSSIDMCKMLETIARLLLYSGVGESVHSEYLFNYWLPVTGNW